MQTEINSVDEYISQSPNEVQNHLFEIRKIILTNAPNASESIAYGMPAYKLNGKPLVYFANFKNHIGFYATPSGHSEFSAELSKYKQGKGSVQFPLNQDIPIDLIRRIVIFRVNEENNKASKPKKTKV